MPQSVAGKMRTLFLVTGALYPPASGRALRNWQNISLLRKYGPVSVLSISDRDAILTTLPEVERWLHFSRPAFEISCWEHWWRRAWPLRPNGHPETDSLYVGTVDRALRNLLRSFRPDLVIVEQIWLYRYIKTIARYGGKVNLEKHNV